MVWNQGDFRTKLVTMALTAKIEEAVSVSLATSSAGSLASAGGSSLMGSAGSVGGTVAESVDAPHPHGACEDG